MLGLQPATNVQGSSYDHNGTDYGVTNKITWQDSPSTGSLTYTIKRSLVNNIDEAYIMAQGIASGTGEYLDVLFTGTPPPVYYYFIEVTDGVDVVVSQSVKVVTVEDMKYTSNNSYQTDNPDALLYNPATDSYDPA
ncbi:hypothetical protein DV702_15440 [Sporosarcina sp. PTS2304]|uniref:hypothetical protein n=1 Tax=Sporosarcina sp. PTS2304 TaxID=2283194 RepID=UPI000E0DD860|nr:hypothetical protein [Sporosarcina sp. PTS2304]AXI00982.1 hypothetical protein DV702_15440 [Sporosarcina sp. PTS2304]